MFFLPKQPIFSQYFKKLSICVKNISTVFSEMSSSFTDFENYTQQAKKIEKEGDSYMHEIIHQLNNSFITPFDREDIYALARKTDHLIDMIYSVIRNMEMYKVTKKREEISTFSELIVKDSLYLEELIKESFEKHKKNHKITSLISNIHELEDEGDIIFQKAITELFEHEKDAILIIQWKDIYENLEDIIDSFQRVSDTIGSMIIKFS